MRQATAGLVHGFGSVRAAETVQTADIVICVQKVNSNKEKRRRSRHFGTKNAHTSYLHEKVEKPPDDLVYLSCKAEHQKKQADINPNFTTQDGVANVY